MKHVVSVSLGSSKGNKSFETEILGEPFKIERIGTDGDLKRFEDLFKELDGKVDALGVGGADIYVVAGKNRYAFRQIQELTSGAKKTPVVDGSGLKHTLERETIHALQREGIVDFKKERVLLVSAVDRYGMAQALGELCPNVLFGDFYFTMGIPLKMRSYRAVERLGKLVLPIVTKLPFKWFYPTGEKQDVRTPKFRKVWDWATVICGDTHFIRRYASDDLRGKTIITQTVRKATIDFFKEAGLWRLVTTTPEMGGETFATNVMEGVVVSLLGKRPEEITEAEYLEMLKKLDWKPNVMVLNPVESNHR